MTRFWRSEGLHLAVIASLFGVAAAVWPYAPVRMPVHWNLAGQVDRYGSRAEGLLVWPALALGMYGLFLVLPRLDPLRGNYEKFAGTYAVFRWAMTGFLAVLYAIVLTSTFDPNFNGTFAGSLAVGALFVVLGNYFGKLRPNWFVGIRTPWTLSSRQSWAKTHRLGGWLFILIGGLIALTGYLRSPVALGVTLTVLFAGTLGLVVYSYLVWKSNPQHEPIMPAGSEPPVNAP
jgi:uncharacterized membrane protein